jgi:nucleoside-diphosphate-sugar epimerase
MKIFITGASGFIGGELAKRLAATGHTIHALVRSPDKAVDLHHPNIRIFQGDLLEQDKIRTAIRGCKQAYHLAAYAKVWAEDPNTFEQVNVKGTLNVWEAAREAGVSRMVATSTAGTLGPSGEKMVNENSPAPDSYFTAYERTKARSEEELLKRTGKGPEVVIVNPSRVFGPGLRSDSNATTDMIANYIRGKWRILPGDGHSIGNYVFVDDVIEGHLLAMENGKAGERYILGGENHSFRSFFQVLSDVSGKSYTMIPLPVSLMLAFAHFQLWKSRRFGSAPLITPDFVKRYLHHWKISSKKAEAELGYSPTSLSEAFRKTIDWIQENGKND